MQGNRKAPHHAVEKYLRQVGAPYTFLRPHFLMQNLTTTYRSDIRDHDEIFLPAGHSRTALIDTRDIGRVAAILSGVLDRTIRCSRPSESEYLARLAAEGKPQDYIDVQKMIYRIVCWNISAFPNRQIRNLTGRPATTFSSARSKFGFGSPCWSLFNELVSA